MANAMRIQRRVLNDIKSRHLKFLCHFIRAEGVESLSLLGKIEGKRLEEDSEAV